MITVVEGGGAKGAVEYPHGCGGAIAFWVACLRMREVIDE
jgi:hypothetical protein